LLLGGFLPQANDYAAGGIPELQSYLRYLVCANESGFVSWQGGEVDNGDRKPFGT